MTDLSGDMHCGVTAERSDNLRCLAYGQLAEEIQTCLRESRQPDIQALARKYPGLVDDIPELLSALATLQRLGQASKQDDRSMTGTNGGTAGQLGDFRILREIGRGGMGIVYEAEQISLGRHMALKVLPFAGVLDERQLTRFRNEARAAASLKHPHIVGVHSVGCERGVHFYAMEFIEGKSLADVIAEMRRANAGLSVVATGDPLPVPVSTPTPNENESTAAYVEGARQPQGPTEVTAQPSPSSPGFKTGQAGSWSTAHDTQREPQAALDTQKSAGGQEFFRRVAQWGTQAAAGLEHAHQSGIVHRDIKPSNLLVDAGGHLWITDFGLAQVQTDAGITMTGDILGTLRYMSPEQAAGRSRVLQQHTDIYSLGVTLYELLTLRPPFPGDDRQAVLRQIADDEPPLPRQLNKAIPKDLETIVLKAMAKEPQRRYATAQELADDLQRFLADEPIRPRRPTLVDRAQKWARRHRPVVWSGVAVVAIAAVLGGAVFWSGFRRAVRLERDSREHLAAATAFLRSANYTAADRELADARGHLEAAGYGAGPLAEDVTRLAAGIAAKTRAMDQFDQFQELRHRIHSEMYAVDRTILNQAQEHCRAALDLFGVFEAGPWKSHADFENLDTARQAMLDEGAVELLFVSARLELRISDTQPAAERTAGYRRAIEALGKIESFHPPIPAAVLWMADCWEAIGDTQASAEARIRAESLQPTSATDYYLLGEYHAQHGRQDEAMASYWQALTQQPDHYLSLLAAGVALGELKEYKSAEAMLTGAIAMNPQTVIAYLQRSAARSAQSKIVLAQADIEEAQKLDPELARALLRRAWEYQATYQFDKALTDYSEAVRLDPTTAAYEGRSVILIYQNDLDKAVADCNECIRLEPGSASAYRTRAEIYRLKEDFVKALADADEAIRLDPQLVQAHVTRAWIYVGLGEFDKGLANFNDAIRLAPKDAGIVCGRAYAYLKLGGEHEKALADCRESIRLDPKNLWGHLALAECYRDSGDFDQALTSLSEAVRIAPQFSRLYRERGEVYRARGNFDKALADYSEAIRVAPQDVATYIARAGLHKDRGDIDKSLADYNEAIRLEPKNGNGYRYAERGILYLDMREFEKAAADLDRAAELAGISYHYYKRRAAAHFQLQHYDKALESIAKAVDLRPEDVSNLIWIPPEEVATCPDDRLRTGLLELADKTIEKTKGAAEAYAVRARLYGAFGQPEKALADFAKAIELEPKNGDVWASRARFYLEQGKWEPGIADLSKAVELRPDDGGFWYHRALARLAAGQANEHRDDCVEMLQRFAQSGTPGNAYWAAWTCALGPDAVTDWSKPLTLAERAAKSDPKSISYATTLGAVLYRAGRFEEALARLSEADALVKEPSEALTSSPTYAWFFLAMAHHRLGHAEEAKQWLDKAVAWTDKTTAEADQGKADLPWNRRLTLKLLRDEATTLLGVTPPTVEPAPEPPAKEEEESK